MAETKNNRKMKVRESGRAADAKFRFSHSHQFLITFIRNTFCEKWYLPHSQVLNDRIVPIIKKSMQKLISL